MFQAFVGILLLLAGVPTLAKPDNSQPHHHHKKDNEKKARKSNRNNRKPKILGAQKLVPLLQPFGLNDVDISSLVTKDEVPSMRDGVKHIYLVQSVNDITVCNGRLRYTIEDGEPMFMHSALQPNCAQCVNTKKPEMTAHQAVEIAAESLGLGAEFGPLETVLHPSGPEQVMSFGATSGLSRSDIPVKLNYFIVSECNVMLIYDIVLDVDGDKWLQLRIDAVSGEILETVNWVAGATYSVFPLPLESALKDTSFGAQYDQYNIRNLTLVVDPESANPLASPKGWHTVGNITYNSTRGNNVMAGADINGTNNAIYTFNTGPNVFNFKSSNLLSKDQTGEAWRDAAVTNLFYWNNVCHDVLHNYGFDEECGNFQEENFSGLGLGNDSVFADAQDGIGFNNAFFGTPPEGFNPRMTMLFSLPPLDVKLVVAGTSYDSVVAGFGPKQARVKRKKVVYGGGDGCSGLTNSTNYFDRIVLIDRGGCFFTTKVINAQKEGAVAVIIANNVPGPPFSMGGVPEEPITIVSVMISLEDGHFIKEYLLASGMSGDELSEDKRRKPKNVLGTIKVKNDKPLIDTSFDNEVIAHEYGHGLSIRLTGGPSDSSCLNNIEQAGEGWSDFFALFLTAQSERDTFRVVGKYAFGDPRGIRPFPYSPNMTINALTYSDISRGLSIPHGIGSFFASCLWDLYWALVHIQGYNDDRYEAGVGGNNIAMLLVVEGLKTQVCNPNFVDSRDGIIHADTILYDGKYECLIWGVFARRGLGVNATSLSTMDSLNVPIEDYAVPEGCPSLQDVVFWPVEYEKEYAAATSVEAMTTEPRRCLESGEKCGNLGFLMCCSRHCNDGVCDGTGLM